MAIDKKTIRELDALLKKIDKFTEALKPLRNTLARHVGQQKRQPSGQ
jgi:hypothetical protein